MVKDKLDSDMISLITTRHSKAEFVGMLLLEAAAAVGLADRLYPNC